MTGPDGAGEPDWVAVSEAPPPEWVRRRKLRNHSIMDVAWFTGTAALVLWIGGGSLGTPVVLVGTIAILAGVGGLFLWRNRSLARDPWVGGFREDGRVGSTPQGLSMEGWWGRITIPWTELSPPVPVTVRGEPRFELRYRVAGRERRSRVGPQWMRAILGLNHVPRWSLSLEFNSALQAALAGSDTRAAPSRAGRSS